MFGEEHSSTAGSQRLLRVTHKEIYRAETGYRIQQDFKEKFTINDEVLTNYSGILTFQNSRRKGHLVGEIESKNSVFE